jgi:hypothetical protein
MYDDVIKKLGTLGFDYYLSGLLESKDQSPLRDLLYTIRKFLVDEFNLFIEVGLDTDLVYFWIARDTKTGKELGRDAKAYDSPEMALESAIIEIVRTWKLQ